MRLAFGSGAGVSATEGEGVDARCNVDAASGSSLHADRAAANAVLSKAILAIRTHVLRVPSDAIKVTLIRVALLESRTNGRGS